MLKVFDPDRPARVPEAGILDRLDSAAEHLRAKGTDGAQIGAALKRLIHSPAVALLVSLTPNKADDAALELLKSLFPAA